MKKRRFIIPSILIALIGSAAAAVAVTASKNVHAMNNVADEGLYIIGKYYNVTPCEPNEYTDITMNDVMKFHTDKYRIENLGNLSVMTTNMGAMQMISFMITPFEKKMPLCTFDFMYIMGTRKSYAEFYDLVPDASTDEYKDILDALREVQSKYADIEEIPASENWYDNYLNVFMHKKLTRKNDDTNLQLFSDTLTAYLEASVSVPVNSAEDTASQLEIIESYSNGLIENGGISTDFFKKNLGEDTTRDFFNKTFFGTDDYRVTTERIDPVVTDK